MSSQPQPQPPQRPQQALLKIGLTGGLAAGKSTVARLLAELGCTVVDADRLVAELYAPGEPGAAAVVEIFGPDLLDEAGAVDRRRVAAVVFDDPERRARLEAAIHPLVRQRFAERAAAATATTSAVARIVVLEATLLVEAGYAPDFDLVVTVEAPPDERLTRAIERGSTPADARARLAAQGDGERRRAAADLVIDNTGSLDDLERQVAALVADWRARLTA